jgi:hypothetical protein
VKLLAALCDAAGSRLGTRFGGPEPFVDFLLKELLKDDAAEMDQNERRIVGQRLKDLGYL